MNPYHFEGARTGSEHHRGRFKRSPALLYHGARNMQALSPPAYLLLQGRADCHVIHATREASCHRHLLHRELYKHCGLRRYAASQPPNPTTVAWGREYYVSAASSARGQGNFTMNHTTIGGLIPMPPHNPPNPQISWLSYLICLRAGKLHCESQHHRGPRSYAASQPLEPTPLLEGGDIMTHVPHLLEGMETSTWVASPSRMSVGMALGNSQQLDFTGTPYDDVSFYNRTASTWTPATPRTTRESLSEPHPYPGQAQYMVYYSLPCMPSERGCRFLDVIARGQGSKQCSFLAEVPVS